ncbi:MAG TPA: hypothetical protein VLJ80_12920 [Solirubrobacteraceae bacterium]|nr:hypothetical protein [Solirubrobacteraceae bacterium]
MSAHKASNQRIELLRWTAGMGAVTCESLALRRRASVASAQAMLSAAARAKQLARHRPLAGRPALYTITRLGLRAAALEGVEPCCVSAASAQHMIACAHVAAALECRYPGQLVIGERELRKREREAGAALASVVLRRVGEYGPLMHRPDLVMLPRSGSPRRPVAVEVELTVKAPRRLAEICRAWTRSRHVDGVLYFAPPAVERALDRAIGVARAGECVVVVPLGSLGSARPVRGGRASAERSIPSDS